MKIKGISVVFFYVRDPDRSKAFYSDALGLGKPFLDAGGWVEWELKGANFAVFKGGSIQTEGSSPERSTTRFSFEVDDIQATYEELFKKGLHVLSEPQEGEGFHYVDLRDPDNNLVRFIQLTTKKGA
ncbi:MAG: VOC family protein [Sumerlaeia bacterium]